METRNVGPGTFRLSMIRRFLHTSITALLALLGVVTQARAQGDSIKFTPNVINLGTVQMGTAKVDTATFRVRGTTRTISLETPDTSVRVLNSANFPVVASDQQSVDVEFRVTPLKPGPQTLYLIAKDSQLVVDTLFIVFSATTASSFTVSPDTVDVGPLLVGGEVIDSFQIVNTGSRPLLISNFVSIDQIKDSSAVLTPLPLSISVGDSAQVRFRLYIRQVTPPSLFRYRVIDSSSQARVVAITYEGISPTDPDSAFAIDPSRKEAFAAIIESDTASFVINLRNTTGGDLFIDSVMFDPSPFFTLLYLPQPVSDGDVFPVTLGLKTTGEGFYKTNIRLPDNGGLASEYTLGAQVLRIAKGSVPVLRTHSGIRITQSPTNIAIEGLPFETGVIEIYDLLGREVAAHAINAREMLIPKLDAFGSRLEDGCYIIRVLDTKGSYSEAIKVLLLSF